MFYIGQKVICVIDDWSTPSGYLPPHLPRAGVEYVVRSMLVDGDLGLSLRFQWLINPKAHFTNGYLEPAFCAFTAAGELVFRPVKTTSIEIFQKMLVPSPREKVRAE